MGKKGTTGTTGTTGTVHGRLIEEIVTDLWGSGCFDFVWQNYDYCVRGVTGEVDVLGFDAFNRVWHFYEVKSRYSHKSLHKAEQQYAKYLSLYPGRDIRGFFVSPEQTIRLYCGLGAVVRAL